MIAAIPRGVFLVTWMAWTCPGTVKFLGIPIPVASLPEVAKARLGALGICRPTRGKALYERRQAAEDRVAELDPEANAPDLALIQGARITERPFTWETEPLF